MQTVRTDREDEQHMEIDEKFSTFQKVRTYQAAL